MSLCSSHADHSNCKLMRIQDQNKQFNRIELGIEFTAKTANKTEEEATHMREFEKKNCCYARSHSTVRFEFVRLMFKLQPKYSTLSMITKSLNYSNKKKIEHSS